MNPPMWASLPATSLRVQATGSSVFGTIESNLARTAARTRAISPPVSRRNLDVGGSSPPHFVLAAAFGRFVRGGFGVFGGELVPRRIGIFRSG